MLTHTYSKGCKSPSRVDNGLLGRQDDGVTGRECFDVIKCRHMVTGMRLCCNNGIYFCSFVQWRMHGAHAVGVASVLACVLACGATLIGSKRVELSRACHTTLCIDRIIKGKAMDGLLLCPRIFVGDVPMLRNTSTCDCKHSPGAGDTK